MTGLILFTLDKNTTPETCVTQQLAVRQQACVAEPADVFAVHFIHSATYLAGQPQVELLAFVMISNTSSLSPRIAVSIFPCSANRLDDVRLLPADTGMVNRYCRQHGLAWVTISSALLLDPAYIPKPWGQEIWYTGIEARGQACVRGENGSLPLPWVMEFLRHRLALVESEQLILLKVLDPLPDEDYGDLYFELHEQKQEVYVVTHVDEQAWPSGQGAIQLGFNPAVYGQYASIDVFKSAYYAAVERYEKTRRALDALLDQKKCEQGFAIDQPVAAFQLKLWIKELLQQTENKDLIVCEKELKKVMNSFIAQQPLKVGDVVAVPRLVPHALQHGVRVVEFQTPVYERKILSFGQKVLTQAHWDTKAALDLVDMNSEPSMPPMLLLNDDGVEVQRIVNFDEFEVRRIRLCGSHALEFERYCLVMVLDGELAYRNGSGSSILTVGDVALIPADSATAAQLNAPAPCLLLQALPKTI